MIADYFTKPLQGKLFKQMRDQIMGKTEIPIKEGVGNQTESKAGMSRMTIGTKSDDESTKKVMYADVVKNGGDVYKVKELNNSHTLGTEEKKNCLVRSISFKNCEAQFMRYKAH